MPRLDMRPFTLDPFTIDIPQADIDDLHRRLDGTRWPEAETVDDWSQGIPLAYVKELADYWRHSYDWRSREARMNAFDQFITEIDDLSIHFIHQRSPEPNAMPLLITHGWPGSIVEFVDVIGPLTDPVAHGGKAEDAFHVVCPSLPGYGFSGKPTANGTGVPKIAALWAALMERLGYESWVAQGGDWGSAVTTQIGRDASSQEDHGCIGIHVNMPIARPTEKAKSDPDKADQEAFAALKFYQQWDSGYSKQQATRPQTLGYSLVDSPVGQLAWIIEKFWAWTDCDGHPENALSRDAMLDNVMMYWLTGSGASSARLYWESYGAFGGGETVTIPCGIASFPENIIRPPRSWCENSYNVTHWTDMPRGGHFAALEQPEMFIDDVRACFRSLRP